MFLSENPSSFQLSTQTIWCSWHLYLSRCLGLLQLLDGLGIKEDELWSNSFTIHLDVHFTHSETIHAKRVKFDCLRLANRSTRGLIQIYKALDTCELELLTMSLLSLPTRLTLFPPPDEETLYRVCLPVHLSHHLETPPPSSHEKRTIIISTPSLFRTRNICSWIWRGSQLAKNRVRIMIKEKIKKFQV